MAGISKRLTAKGEARYDVRTRVNGRAVTKTFHRRRDADAWALRIEHDRLDGIAVDPRAGRILFAQYADAWLAARPELAATTRHDYARLIAGHLGRAFATMEVSAITTPAIRLWWAALATTSPLRAAKAYRLLRTIMATAENDGLISRNPCRVAGAGQEHSPERPTAAIAEVAALADAMPEQWSVLVQLASWCGVRRGELLALRRCDVDQVLHVERSLAQLPDGSFLFKAPKTAAGRRRVAIPPHLDTALDDHLERHVAADPDALLATGDKGGPLRHNVLQAAWDAARRQVGRADLHFHDLRHSGNTWAASTGASTAELMARMGHASPVAALRYQHATSERDRVLADALSAMAVTTGVVPLVRPRDGRAMEPPTAPATTTRRGPENSLSPAVSPEQPQRDSNPCLHLERVMS